MYFLYSWTERLASSESAEGHILPSSSELEGLTAGSVVWDYNVGLLTKQSHHKVKFIVIGDLSIASSSADGVTHVDCQLFWAQQWVLVRVESSALFRSFSQAFKSFDFLSKHRWEVIKVLRSNINLNIYNSRTKSVHWRRWWEMVESQPLPCFIITENALRITAHYL